ncbi:MAG: glycosyltransferase family 2 protein, partial [Bacteroidales bacterium]
MNNERVSIIIPVYNVAHYIERCARSLYEQTYSNIEYIWVNDATPDESIEIL